MVFQQTLSFRTRGRGTTSITADVAKVVAASGVRTGLCTVFVQHTTASLVLCENADADDVFMASDPASVWPLTGNPGVAGPFDPYRVIEQVVDAYDVTWVIVLRPDDGDLDPLGLWEGAAATDSEGAHPSFMPAEPSFEGDNVRVFRVPGR